MRLSYIFIIIIMLLGRPAFAAPTFEYAFSPKQGATELIVNTLNKATKSVELAAYSFTSYPIANALAAAKRRGVHVRIVLDKSQQEERYGSYRFLKRRGIDIRISSNYTIMHNKFMIIDSKILQLGSFNYTMAAEENNAENVLVINDARKLAHDYSEQWQKLWDEAKYE